MEEQAMGIWWALAIFAVVIAGVIGFWIGRSTADDKKLVRELEVELERRMTELNAYRASVHTHFDRTANLFANMAGAYRDLYHHLADSCQQLADKPTLDRLEHGAGRLLANVPKRDGMSGIEPHIGTPETLADPRREPQAPPTDYDPQPDEPETKPPQAPRAD